MLKLFFIGNCRVYDYRKDISIPISGKNLELLAFLASFRNRRANRRDIIAQLWPNIDEDLSRGSLRVLFSRLKSLIGTQVYENLLTFDGDYALIHKNVWIDIDFYLGLSIHSHRQDIFLQIIFDFRAPLQKELYSTFLIERISEIQQIVCHFIFHFILFGNYFNYEGIHSGFSLLLKSDLYDSDTIEMVFAILILIGIDVDVKVSRFFPDHFINASISDSRQAYKTLHKSSFIGSSHIRKMHDFTYRFYKSFIHINPNHTSPERISTISCASLDEFMFLSEILSSFFNISYDVYRCNNLASLEFQVIESGESAAMSKRLDLFVNGSLFQNNTLMHKRLNDMLIDNKFQNILIFSDYIIDGFSYYSILLPKTYSFYMRLTSTKESECLLSLRQMNFPDKSLFNYIDINYLERVLFSVAGNLSIFNEFLCLLFNDNISILPNLMYKLKKSPSFSSYIANLPSRTSLHCESLFNFFEFFNLSDFQTLVSDEPNIILDLVNRRLISFHQTIHGEFYYKIQFNLNMYDIFSGKDDFYRQLQHILIERLTVNKINNTQFSDLLKLEIGNIHQAIRSGFYLTELTESSFDLINLIIAPFISIGCIQIIESIFKEIIDMNLVNHARFIQIFDSFRDFVYPLRSQAIKNIDEIVKHRNLATASVQKDYDAVVREQSERLYYDNVRLPDRIIFSINAGSACMRNSAYDDALIHFQSALSLSKQYSIRNLTCISLIHLSHCYSRLNFLDLSDLNLQLAKNILYNSNYTNIESRLPFFLIDIHGKKANFPGMILFAIKMLTFSINSGDYQSEIMGLEILSVYIRTYNTVISVKITGYCEKRRLQENFPRNAVEVNELEINCFEDHTYQNCNISALSIDWLIQEGWSLTGEGVLEILAEIFITFCPTIDLLNLFNKQTRSK